MCRAAAGMMLKEFLQVLRDPRMMGILFLTRSSSSWSSATSSPPTCGRAHRDLGPRPEPGVPRAGLRLLRLRALPVRAGDGDIRGARRSWTTGTWPRSSGSTKVRGGPSGRTGRPSPAHRRRHRLEHGQDRARVRRPDRGALPENVRVARFPASRQAAPRRRRGAQSSRAWFNENLESRTFFVPGSSRSW